MDKLINKDIEIKWEKPSIKNNPVILINREKSNKKHRKEKK